MAMKWRCPVCGSWMPMSYNQCGGPSYGGIMHMHRKRDGTERVGERPTGYKAVSAAAFKKASTGK